MVMGIMEALAVIRDAQRPSEERIARLEDVVACLDDSETVQAVADSQLLAYLLSDWDTHPQGGGSAERSDLLVAKWRAVAQIVRTMRLNAETLAALLEAMRADRLASLEAQMEVSKAATAAARAADCSVSLLSIATSDKEGFLDLFKQHYVTLVAADARREIVAVVCGATRSKDDSKRVLRSQLLRSVVRVAIDGQLPLESDGKRSAPLVSNAARLLRCVVVHVCDATDDMTKSEEEEDGDDESGAVRALCELVVRLMLSRVPLAFEEATRVLQTLVEAPACRSALLESVHLRGALAKAHRFAELKPGSLASDPYLVLLCEQQHAQLSAEIDALERARGASLVGLPSETDAQPLDEVAALQEAARRKERGNWFFRRGDFVTARAFYRHAVLVLRVTQRREEQRLEMLSKAEKLARCSAGASVQVRRASGRGFRDAMIADVEDEEHIEVLYDRRGNATDRRKGERGQEESQEEEEEEEEEEVVTLDRIRLRMDTKTLDAFASLQVDCFMNMGKAASGMYDHERAVEGFTSALELDESHASALYHRGASFLALHDLKHAQQDLWRANQQCRALLKAGSSLATEGEDAIAYQRQLEAAKALQKQVASAYKRLQQMHASKKKLDKKVIKQVVRYLSTIPGLQGDQ